MRVIKSLIISFSMYSRIPMPTFEWKEEDMRYSMIFFPWVGIVIGILEYLWLICSVKLGLNNICQLLVAVALPILITGGIHVDGYMDTMDAFKSYQGKEKKLEILKDPHIGAFSVITLVIYYLIYMAGLSQIESIEAFEIFCLGFYLSRILSGIAVVSFQSAKEDGTLYTFASSAHRILVKLFLFIQFIICISIMMMLSMRTGAITITVSILIFIYYWLKTKKELGGITGDTAGYFLLLCECGVVITCAIESCM